MSSESYREGEPPWAPTDASAGDDRIPSSIALPPMSRWECAGVCSLLAASPVFLAIGFLLRTGRDLTIPFVAGEAVVLANGICLVVLGLCQGNKLRAGVGALSVVLPAGIVFFGAGTLMLWSGAKDIEFEVIVTDATTGKPIPNALASFAIFDDVAMAQTDREGTAKINWRCRTGGRSSTVCDTGFVSIWGKVKVGAVRYEEIQIELEELTGRGWPLHDPPPTMRIQLTPKR